MLNLKLNEELINKCMANSFIKRDGQNDYFKYLDDNSLLAID